MSDYKRQRDDIEYRYRKYREPCVHPDYVKARHAFLSSQSNVLKFGDGIEQEFRQQWTERLENDKNEEIQNLQRKFGIDPKALKRESDDSSDSSPGVPKYPKEKHKQIDTIYESKLIAAKSLLKSKYNEFYNVPESNDDYAYYKERFRTNSKNSGLSRAKKEREWRRYWNNKMDEAFDAELQETTRRIWREVLVEHSKFRGKKRSGTREVTNKKSNDEAAQSSINAKTTPSDSKVARSSLSPASLVSSLEVPHPVQVKQEKDQVLSSQIPQLLERYDIKVRQVTENVQKEFQDYKQNSATYPDIEKEREVFLKKEITDNGSYSKELVLKFDEKFAAYWTDRLEVLLAERIVLEVKKVQENWKNLFNSPKKQKRASTDEQERSSKIRHKSNDISLESHDANTLHPPKSQPPLSEQAKDDKKAECVDQCQIVDVPKSLPDTDTNNNNEVSVTMLRCAKNNATDGTTNFVVDDNVKYMVMAPQQLTKAELPHLMNSVKREIFNRYMASYPTTKEVIVVSDDEEN